MDGKRIGVVVEVNDQYSKVGVYSLLNDLNIIWKGEILSGIKVGSFLTINQNDVRIISTITSEKVIDQQNTVNSIEFDNRFNKNSVNRIIELKIKGVIENDEFKITSRYVPMVGNEVSLTSKEELNIIYGLKKNEDTIVIGKTILENYPVQIPINRFFASHVGIFGNTGSGKSNTLHKLYFELFKTKFFNSINSKSKLFVIDFNGEYNGDEIFGLSGSNRKIININTRTSRDRLKILDKYLFNADILSMLFDARPATQVPFLKRAIFKFGSLKNATDFAQMEIGLLCTILISIKGNNNINCLDNWIEACIQIGIDEKHLEGLKEIHSTVNYSNSMLYAPNNTILLEHAQLTRDGEVYLKIDSLKEELKDIYSKASALNKFRYFVEFQRVFEITYNSTKADFINPLLNRIRPAIEAINNVVEIVETNESISSEMMTIISLVNANSQIKRLTPMLLSKMIYDEQKEKVSKEKSINGTVHLIIDEAHNILNGQFKDIGDDWKDYRLSIFEEIIKEGRKFGFYLTLASQRPADISPTIMSQLHNYIIHRLVNDKDLQMLANTMPTLDLLTYKAIPMMGQGEAIITGTALKIPIVAKIDKIKEVRPSSDDIVLTELWET